MILDQSNEDYPFFSEYPETEIESTFVYICGCAPGSSHIRSKDGEKIYRYLDENNYVIYKTTYPNGKINIEKTNIQEFYPDWP